MKISILEDNILLAKNISKKLINNWYEVSIYNSVTSFISEHNISSDLYIIDISLWDWNWFNVIKWLREIKKIFSPIIITSSYSETEKKIYWLDIWADDYLTKPFVPDELLARIRTLLRRKNWNSSIIKHWNLEFDLKSKELKLSWEIIHFWKKEKLIIEFFLLNKWELVDKNKLVSSIWWANDILLIKDNTINVTISRVRKRLWDNFNLKTIVGWGYILS